MFASLELVVQDLNDFTFELGLTLNKYHESTEVHSWIRKELSIGFILFSVRLNWIFELEGEESDKEE